MSADKPVCSPLCAADKAYGRFVKPWQHEAECPVRIQWESDRAASRVPQPDQEEKRMGVYETQYDERVPHAVRQHTEDLMRSWRDGGRDDERIEDLVKSVVLNAYLSGYDAFEMTP